MSWQQVDPLYNTFNAYQLYPPTENCFRFIITIFNDLTLQIKTNYVFDRKLRSVSISFLNWSLKSLSMIKYIIGFPKWLMKYTYIIAKVSTTDNRNSTVGTNDIANSNDIKINIFTVFVSRLFPIFLDCVSPRDAVALFFKCRGIFTVGNLCVFESFDFCCVVVTCAWDEL